VPNVFICDPLLFHVFSIFLPQFQPHHTFGRARGKQKAYNEIFRPSTAILEVALVEQTRKGKAGCATFEGVQKLRLDSESANEKLRSTHASLPVAGGLYPLRPLKREERRRKKQTEISRTNQLNPNSIIQPAPMFLDDERGSVAYMLPHYLQAGSQAAI